MTSSPIITTSNLSRTYRMGDIEAVRDLNLSIERSTIYALLGPNGAGKTTTISMLTTLLPPTSGSASVAGFDVQKDPEQVRARIGVTFQEIVLDKDLKGREVLDYHGQLYGMKKPERRARIEELLTLVELEEAADRMVKTYSGGMKRRLELARGLMTAPDVLFLDEPTQGLDPQNRSQVWKYLQGLSAERGLTILLTTHYMEEAEILADYVGIIDDGNLVVEGTPEGLTADVGEDMVRVTGSGNAVELARLLRDMDYVHEVVHVDGVLQIGVDHGNRRLSEIVETANHSQFQVEDISVSRPGLGDVFLKMTGYALRDT